MCGIVGYIGKKPAFPILLSGLKRILYRGYDSFGWAILDSKGEINYFKTPGKFDEWEEKVAKMDFKGNAGIAHCLTPDTLVQLADGRVIEISKIRNGDKVLALNSKTWKFEEARVKVFKHKSPNYLYEIKTASTSIKATAKHKMLVFLDGELKEKEVGDISKKDFLIFPKKIDIKGKKLKFHEVPAKRYYKILGKTNKLIKNKLMAMNLSQLKLASLTDVNRSYVNDIFRNNRHFREDQLQNIFSFLGVDFSPLNATPQNSRQGKFINFPRESSSELMQVIGYFLGDGSRWGNYIRFKEENEEILKIYRTLIQKIFGIEGKIRKLKKKNAFILEVVSTPLSNWFKINITSRKNEFLREIGKLPTNETASFLRGIFDAEGTVALDTKQISLDMTDRKLMRAIQYLFLRIGIPTSLLRIPSTKKNWHDRYRFNLSNSEVIQKFLGLVGFTSYQKQCKAEEVLTKKRKEDFRNFKIFPFRKREIYNRTKKYLKATEFSNLLGGYLDGFITKRRLLKFLNFLKRRARQNSQLSEIISWLEKFLKGEITFQLIIEKRKIKSRFSYLYDLEVNPHSNFIANCIFSHNSRWATHGAVNKANSHPHWDCSESIYIVHNGIIENYKELKEKLIKEGHKFTSETDTEVICHLIEKYFQAPNQNKFGTGQGNLEEAVRKALKEVRGTYGIAVISREDPQKIVTAKLSSPLILGINNEEFLVASDPTALITRTRQIINLDDNEIAVLKPDNFFIIKEKPLELIEWTPEEAEKGGYPHFMLKETMEQPESLQNSQRGRLILEEGMAKLGGLESVKEKLRKIKRLIIVACGTAYHAGLVGECMLEEYARIPVEVEIASEFRYKKPILDKNTAVLAISQSGETADTLAAIKEAKEKGALTLGIVNSVGSSIARETEAGVYNHAGPEIGVASTKAFTSQIEVLALLALFFGRQNEMSLVIGQRIAKEILKIPELVKEVLKTHSQIEKLAEKYKEYNNFLFIGRKYNFPIALEGALKLKEISYVNAQGYGAGEMKHGSLALIDENFPTIAICPSDSVYDKMVSNIEEIKARKGKVIAITTEGNEEIKNLVDEVIYIPKTLEMLTPILSVIPLQLFAYYMGVLRGCDVDKPRNLAKAVCVE